MQARRFYLGICGLVLLLFGLISQLVVAHDVFFFGPINLVAGGLLLGAFLLGGGFRAFQTTTLRRRAGFGLGALVYSALFVGLLGVINYAALRYELFRYDSTKEKVYTLAPQTREVLSELKQPLVLRGFFLAGRVEPALEQLITRLERFSDSIRWQLVDPEKNPTLVTKYGINEPGTIHLSFADEGSARAVKIARDIDEQVLVNAVLKLTRGGARRVYYLTGHGEPKLDDASQTGYLFLKESVEGENVALSELVLAKHNDVPQDADAIIISAPKKPLVEKERAALQRYIDGGGAAIVLNESRHSRSIADFVGQYGVVVGNDIVIDEEAAPEGGTTHGVQPMVTTYGMHPVTRGFEQGTLFSIVSSVTAAPNLSEGNSVVALAFTSETSWAERNMELLFGEPPSAAREADDLAGPVSVAVGATTAGGARLVVFGDADFVSNLFIRQLFNRDLFLNALNWVLGDDKPVTIRARTLTGSTQRVTAEQVGVLFLITVLLIPELLLLGGLAVWVSRRSG